METHEEPREGVPTPPSLEDAQRQIALDLARAAVFRREHARALIQMGFPTAAARVLGRELPTLRLSFGDVRRR